MTAIVMNTASGAVTEYDWALQSISPSHGTSAAGLQTLAGNADDGAPIPAELRSGLTGGETTQRVSNVFLALHGDGTGSALVFGRTTTWTYPLVGRASGVSKASPGKGIQESYLGFGYVNAAGADFRLDRIDADVIASKNRRK